VSPIWSWCAWVLLAVGATACRGGGRRETAPPTPAVGGAAAAIAPRAPLDLGDPTQQFLVHAAGGAIELRSRVTRASRQVAAHADTALYHPSLALVWLIDGDRLSVVDLRVPGAAPVVVARGVPAVGHLSISHPPQSAETEDGCDVPYLSLDWAEPAKIEAVLTQAPDLRIENPAWLHAQLARPARVAGKRRAFTSERVRLPPKLLDCEDKQACGASVAFGTRGLSLVRVLEKPGGDCVQRACLLRDPRTRLFATPAQAEVWAPPEITPRGTCGPFLFDETATAYLAGHQLCAPDRGCQDLKGNALGWLVPGDTVGAPGAFDARP
jgi:hypothetical protein